MAQKKINIKLLPVKAHYFFFNAAGSALWPFVPVIGKQMGISANDVGVVYAIAPVMACVSKPLFGLVADRLKKRKKTFIFFLLLALTSSLSLGFLPQVQPDRPVLFECGDFGTNYLIQRGGPRLSQYDEASVLSAIQKSATPSKRDVCHLKCEINSFVEGMEFCKNLNMEENHKPERCKLRPKMETDTSNAENPKAKAIKSSKNKPFDLRDRNSVIESKPYELAFDVILKLENTDISGGDLFLPIVNLSFYPNKVDPLSASFHYFSCYEKTSLFTCFADCPKNEQLKKRLERVLEDPEFFESSSFWLYGILVVLAFTAFAVSTSVSDALCFQTLGPKPQNYGMQRQWGAVGWGIFTLVAGYLIDTNSEGKLLKDYSPCFYLLAVLYIMDLLVVYKWDVEEVDKPKQIRRDIWQLVTDLRVILFAFACMIVGMCTALHWNFLFWYIEDLAADDHVIMDWIKVLQGVMVAVQCFSELPFFHFAGWFLEKLGYSHAMTLVLGAFGIRFLIYSLLSHPWAFVPVELFQGITFGIFYSLMTSYASAISPPGAASTIQGLVGAVFEGVGIAAGSLVGGIFLKTWGGSVAYRLFGIGALVFCGLHAILAFSLTKVNTDYDRGSLDQEGQEMCKVNGVLHEVDTESQEDGVLHEVDEESQE